MGRRFHVTDDSLDAIAERDSAWTPSRGGVTCASRAAWDRRILLQALRSFATEVQALADSLRRDNEARPRATGGDPA